MKKITKAKIHAHWEQNRLVIWLFIAVVCAFIFTLIYTRLMIFEALRQNSLVESGFNVNRERADGLKNTNDSVRESEFLVLNEAQGNLDELNFLMSPNGQSIAYIFVDKKFNKRSVSLNGQAGASYDDIFFMQYSSSGQRFAYGAKVNGRSTVVLDGQEGKIYDWIFEPHFFTPDNQYFVYKARTDKGDVLVFNQWESRPYDRIYGITVNNSKTKLVFFARKDNKIWRGVVDLNKPLESNEALNNITEQ